jgi:hypothetical protein
MASLLPNKMSTGGVAAVVPRGKNKTGASLAPSHAPNSGVHAAVLHA